MKELTDRETWDTLKVLEDKDYFCTLPDHRKTAAVAMVAVFQSGFNLEYVPDHVLNKDICKMALRSDEVDCTVLPFIPYPEIQKEGVQKFSANTDAFVLYSFVNIQDKETAYDAVKANAYCLQFVPDKLLTKELCLEALKSPSADDKMSKFIFERFPELEKHSILEGEKTEQKTSQKLKI